MFRDAAMVTVLLLLSVPLALAEPAAEGGIYCCEQTNGTLFFTDDPKHLPANCQPFERDSGPAGLILLPDRSLPEKPGKAESSSGPWRIDEWRPQLGGRTPS